MLVAVDIKFIGLDQKQRRNSQVSRASPTCFWSSLINCYQSQKTFTLFSNYHASLEILRDKERKPTFVRTFLRRAIQHEVTR